MTYLLTVFSYEVRQQFRRKAYLFVTFAVPLLAIAGFLGYRAYHDATQDEEDQQVTPVEEVNQGSTALGYVDLTPDGLFPAPESYEEVDCAVTADDADAMDLTVSVNAARAAFIKRISSPYCLRSRVQYYASLDEGKDALERDEVVALYAVEPDFIDEGNLSLYLSGFSIQEMTTTEDVMKDYVLRSLLISVEPEEYETLYLRLRDPGFVIEHQFTKEGVAKEESEDEDFITTYAFGLVLMLSLFWGGGYLMQSVVNEKESRIIEIVLSSVRPTLLLAGKVLANGLTALLQIVMFVAALVFVITQLGDVTESLGDIEISAGALLVMLVYFVLGFLFFGSLMAAIGAVSSSVREAQNFVVVVTLPAAIPFFFLTILSAEPHGTIAVALSMIPMTAPMTMIMRSSITDVPVTELALSIAVMVVSVVAAIWLAGRLFRVNTLLMGNTPKLRDIPRLLRG